MAKKIQKKKSETDDAQVPSNDVLESPLTADELRAIAQEVSASYPPPRLGTELVLLEINPHRAHAYWNIDVADFNAAAAACGDPSPPILLRLYDVTGVDFDGANAHSYFDMQVQGLQGHWYVDLWKDGRSYIADLGLRRADGRLEILARSNPVSTPPAAESSRYHTEAVNTAQPEPALRLTDLIGDPNLSPENTDVETGAEIDLNPPPLHIVPAPDPAAYRAPDAPVDPSEPPFAEFLPSSEPVGKSSERTEDRAFPLPVGADMRPAAYPPVGPSIRESDYPVEPASGSVEPRSEPAPTAEQPAIAIDQPAALTPQTDEGRPDWPTAEELSRFIPDSPSAEEIPSAHSALASASASDSASVSQSEPARAPEVPTAPPSEPERREPGPPASLPLENYVTLFSAEHGRRQVALEVNVELHIFGRAKPGTQVSFYGQPVPLRPDGSFSLRKPLPHGAVVLPLLAIDPPQP